MNDEAQPLVPIAVGPLLARAEGGDAAARQQLFSTLYAQLRRMARREVARFGPQATLGATTLLHEVYLELSRREGLQFPDEARFVAYAARAMRGVVIDHVRERQAQKRGGGLHITALDTLSAEQIGAPEELVQVHEALEELEKLEPVLAQVVDLKFFCGFNFADIAAMHQVSERTVQRQWERARIFLHRSLQAG